MRLSINRETYADDRRLFYRATRAIKRYVIPLARDKKLNSVRLRANTQNLHTNIENPDWSLMTQ